jgi:hypothetical protein
MEDLAIIHGIPLEEEPGLGALTLPGGGRPRKACHDMTPLLSDLPYNPCPPFPGARCGRERLSLQ